LRSKVVFIQCPAFNGVIPKVFSSKSDKTNRNMLSSNIDNHLHVTVATLIYFLY
jgi:hypothetical protein